MMRHLDNEDVGGLAGLHQRSPLLAATLTLSMVSLAGIPPLAGFFGKFLLLKAVIEQGAANHAYYYLAFVALAGVVISLYYYGGVIRAIYFGKETPGATPITMSLPARAVIAVCIGGIFYLGIFPGKLLDFTTEVARSFAH